MDTYLRMGLKTAPGEFQQFMENCLHDFRYDFCALYLDDVIIYSKSFGEHIEHVRQVLRRLRDNGIKLKANKCNFFQKEVCYLGRIVSEYGYCIAPECPMEELRRYEPKNVRDVQKLLDLLGYYCHYIENFSRIAKPIYDLLKADVFGQNPKVQPSKSKTKKPPKKVSGSFQNCCHLGRTASKSFKLFDRLFDQPTGNGLPRFFTSIYLTYRCE